MYCCLLFFFFSSRRRHTRYWRDWSSDVCSSDLYKKRGKRMVSDEFIAKTMERLAALGGLCQLHCENGDVLCYLEDKAIAEGRTAPTDFPGTCPDWTEEEAINRAILIGQLTGCPVYVVHLSTKLGLERIKRAQAEGQRVWTETCPQYLLLTDKEMER